MVRDDASLSGDKVRQILDSAPDAMVVVDQRGTIVYANAQTEKLFGYDPARLVGEPLELLIPERFRHSHAGHVARYFAQPGTRSMGSGLELFGRRADGRELPIEVSLSPVGSDAGFLVSAAIRDISERRALETAAHEMADELRLARTAAEAGSAAKSEFLSSMSHELRTPMNAILGFAQLLQRDKKEPLSTRHRERVDQILKGGEHLLRLIDDILDLSRIEAGGVSISSEPVDVLDVLHEIHTTLEASAARQNIRLAIDSPLPDRPMVWTDRTRFAQILMNLGSNAIKYNRPAGSVTFAVSAPSEGTVRVTVRDTGMGIPIEKQDKLFQPFQRAGQETGTIEGTGIGLVITKKLAELMAGEVGFESAVGKGSAFWVTLPRHESRPRPSPTPLIDPGPRRIEGARLILYVEDNPANVLFMKDVLGAFEAIELVTAATAEVGIEIARRRRPEIIVMDINLPGMSGVDALHVLRAGTDTQDIPVIALTAAASERDRQRGEHAGFFRYLTKPVKVDELLAALEVLLEQPR